MENRLYCLNFEAISFTEWNIKALKRTFRIYCGTKLIVFCSLKNFKSFFHKQYNISKILFLFIFLLLLHIKTVLNVQRFWFFKVEAIIRRRSSRSSRRRCSVKKSVFKYFANFTGKHLVGVFLIKLQTFKFYNFIKKRLQHKCFPVKFAKSIRTLILTAKDCFCSSKINVRQCSLCTLVKAFRKVCERFFLEVYLLALQPVILLKHVKHELLVSNGTQANSLSAKVHKLFYVIK